jgi:hypothetical protein
MERLREHNRKGRPDAARAAAAAAAEAAAGAGCRGLAAAAAQAAAAAAAAGYVPAGTVEAVQRQLDTAEALWRSSRSVA